MQYNEVNSSPANLTNSYKFWIASSGFFETSLIFYPVYNAEFLKADKAKNSEMRSEVKIIDSDGNQINEITCSFDFNKVSVLEMSSFLEGLKYEAGIKHGLAEIKCSQNLGVQCRFVSHSSASISSNLLEVSRLQKRFLPLRIGENINTILSIANLTKDTNCIRAKLFIGKRSPEINIDMLPGSVRVISLANEFADCLDNKSYASPGYLRVSSKNDLSFGMQVIESFEGNKEEAVFSTIL